MTSDQNENSIAWRSLPSTKRFVFRLAGGAVHGLRLSGSSPVSRVVLGHFALRADLQPPLGYPGGSCHLMRRIRDTVRNPSLQQKLIQQAESGEKATPSDEDEIYDAIVLQPVPKTSISRLIIQPHAQYRMDQRGITVNDVVLSLQEFQDTWMKAKQKSPSDPYTQKMRSRGDFIEWKDSKGLFLALRVINFEDKPKTRVDLWLHSAYWLPSSNPKPVPESSCPHAKGQEWEGWAQQYPAHGLERNLPKVLASRWLSRQADLNPPLGVPGGPCQVYKRIKEEVPSQELQVDLIEDYKEDGKLENPEASKIYKIIPGDPPSDSFIKQVLVSAHAQFRMDQRSISMKAVRNALYEFSKELARARANPKERMKAADWEDSINRGLPIRYEGKSITVVFSRSKSGEPGSVNLITTYPNSGQDPKPVPEQSCRLG